MNKELLDSFNEKFLPKSVEEPTEEQKSINAFETCSGAFDDEPDYGSMNYIEAKLAYIRMHGTVDNDYFRDKVWQPAKVKAILAKEALSGKKEEAPLPHVEIKQVIKDGFNKFKVKTDVELCVKESSAFEEFVEGLDETEHLPILNEPIKDADYSLMPQGLKEAQQRNEIRDHGIAIPNMIEFLSEEDKVELTKEQIEPVELDESGQNDLFGFEIKTSMAKIADEHERFLEEPISITPMLDKALEKSESPIEILKSIPKEILIAKADEFESKFITHNISKGEQIFLQVLGEPTAQKRHRSVNVGGFTRQYDPSEADKADFLSIVQQYAPETPLNVPIKLDIVFHFTRPKSHYRTGKNAHLLKDNLTEWHTARPDCDNCIKFVMDALNKIYWRDDSVICSVSILKRYSQNPRTEITITKL